MNEGDSAVVGIRGNVCYWLFHNARLDYLNLFV